MEKIEILQNERKDKIEELAQKGCLNDFVRGNNYNPDGCRSGDKGGRRGSFKGGYVRGWGNNNQQSTRQSEQRQHENPLGAV